MRLGSRNHPAENSSTPTTRADEVRRRRTQRSQQRVSSAVTRAANPVNPRPVIVRGHASQGLPWNNPPKKAGQARASKPSLINTPLYNKSNNRGRRQFYLTMDQYTGTEMRLPAIPMPHPGWRLLSGLIAVAMLVAIYGLLNSSRFQVSAVKVQGLTRISEQEINDTLHIQDEPVIDLDGNQLKDELVNKYPELVNVRVDVSLPNEVTVSAGERAPVIAVHKGDSTTWIDAEGVVFPQRGDAAAYQGKLLTINTEDDLPIVAPAVVATATPSADAAQADTGQTDAAAKTDSQPTAAAGPQKIDPALIAAAQALSQKLPPETALVYSKDNGLGWTDQQGTQVFIGKDMTDFGTKFVLYQEIAKYLSDQGQKATLIDVAQINAPFYRLEQQSNGG